jgi:hypothetical protein
MNTVTQITPDASATPGYLPPNTSRWTRDRDLVRDACVERSRAGFLAMRLLALREGSTAGEPAASADLLLDTRAELQGIVVRYASLLFQLGESRTAVLSLVNELAASLAAHAAWSSSTHVDALRADLLQWALDACVPVYTGELRPDRTASSMQRTTDSRQVTADACSDSQIRASASE